MISHCIFSRYLVQIVGSIILMFFLSWSLTLVLLSVVPPGQQPSLDGVLILNLLCSGYWSCVVWKATEEAPKALSVSKMHT